MRVRFLLFSVAVIPLLSQTYTGSIGGKVTDSGGLPISKAAVTVTEEATNTVFKAQTSIRATISCPT